jgi:hypothetical protein
LAQVELEEPSDAFAVALGFGHASEGRGDAVEVDGSHFQPSDDEAGDEVESAWVELKVVAEGVSDGFILHLATSSRLGLVALILVFLCGGRQPQIFVR